MKLRTYLGIAVAWGVGVFAAAGASASDPAPKAKVSLLSSVEAVAPGKAFDLGIYFQLEPGWNIYWQNPGDSGLAPRVTWTLPDGFSVGELRYPIPKRHHSPGDIVTNILSGDPMLVAQVAPAADLKGDSLRLRANVTYLVCSDKCIREQATVSIDVSVLARGAETVEANARLLGRARRAQPQSTSKSLTVTPRLSPPTLRSGSKFMFELDVKIKRGMHIQSNTPTLDSLIPADVFLYRTPGVFFEKAVYPKAKTRRDKYLGNLSEFAGKITIKIAGEVDGGREAGPIRLGGLFRYQACTDKGNCLPPAAVSFSVDAMGAKRADATSGATSVTTATPIARGDSSTSEILPSASAAKTDSVNTTGNDEVGLEGFFRKSGLLGLLAGCFLYGLFINATPCVLPLLSIKVLGFVQQAHESRKRTLVLGLAFGAGVLLFFVILGLLAAQGKNVLQYPAGVIALGAVVMALSLSMLGVYTLQVPSAATSLDAKIQREGVASSFGKGALAPVLGFACTGPLLAGAFGWATKQEPHIAVLAFVFAGLGMASPYVLLGANPNWLSFLPKPGNWMITFERIMGFLLLGMVIWLLHPLVYHIGAEGLEWTLAFLVFVAMACWIWGKIDVSMSTVVRWKYRAGAGGLVLSTGMLIYGLMYPLGEAVAAQKEARTAGIAAPTGAIAWQTWSQRAVEDAVRGGSTVFVDFTSVYCTNCKVNKKLAINRDETVAKMEELRIIPFQADFSDGDEDVFAGLQAFDVPGPPLNLIYPAGKPNKPIKLATLFTLADLLDAFDRAGPSHVKSASAVSP